MRRAAGLLVALSSIGFLSSCGVLDLHEFEEHLNAQIPSVPIQKLMPDAPSAQITIPSLDGLGLTRVGPPDDGPVDAVKWLRKITVDVPAEGAPRVTDVRDASRWRGIALPRDEGQQPIPRRVDGSPQMLVRVSGDGAILLGVVESTSVGQMRSKLKEMIARTPELRLVLVSDAAARMAHVLPVLAALVGLQNDLALRMPAPEEDQSPWRKTSVALFPRLKVEAASAGRDANRLPNASVRIRADAEALWGSVQGVVIAAMRAYVWRLSFA
ncbi:MAG: hypothetical protein ACYS9X_14055, partial [Planctomycetota bacterium]